jgi:5-methylcytosine-specific restriction endonuclease McrA
MKRTPLKRKKKNSNKERWAKDVSFYKELWEKSNKKCQVTGTYLGLEPLTTYFHHCLPKSKYPQYRWCPWNIMILHPQVHDQVEIDIDKVPMVKERTAYLLNEHNNGNLLKCI